VKTIAVRLDGLLVEDSSALPNADPIPAAVEFVRTLHRGGYDRMFIVTSAPEEVSSETIRSWLRLYQVPMTDIVRLVPPRPADRNPAVTIEWREEDQVLTAAGARSTVLGLYVVASFYDTAYMAAHGVPVVAFAHADAVVDYRPERGLTWSSYGLLPEEA
jgi:hypothetical protein